MKKIVSLKLLLVLLPTSIYAQDQPAQAQELEGDGLYAFSGVSVRKNYRKELAPVVGATKRKVELDTDNGLKRVSFGQEGILVSPAIATTKIYAEVGDLDYYFDNMAEARRANSLQNAFDADVEYADAKINEIHTTQDQVVAGQPKGMSKEDFAVQLADGIEEAKAIKEDLPGMMSQRVDTIFLSFNVVPSVDVRNAYCVAVVSHDNLLSNESREPARASVFSIEKMGNLQAGLPNKVSFSVRIKEQLVRNLGYKLFLFSGTGDPIATNLSKNLKRLTVAEYNALQEHLKHVKAMP